MYQRKAQGRPQGRPAPTVPRTRLRYGIQLFCSVEINHISCSPIQNSPNCPIEEAKPQWHILDLSCGWRVYPSPTAIDFIDKSIGIVWPPRTKAVRITIQGDNGRFWPKNRIYKQDSRNVSQTGNKNIASWFTRRNTHQIYWSGKVNMISFISVV